MKGRDASTRLIGAFESSRALKFTPYVLDNSDLDARRRPELSR